MKFKLFALFLIAFSIFSFSLSSCTKTTVQKITNYDTTTIVTHDTLVTRDTIIVLNTKNPIIGLWVGTLTADNEPAAGPLYYSFDIRADSTIITQSQGADGFTYYNQGTWALSSDSTFTATTVSTTNGNSGVLQTITAVYSKYYGTLSAGVWKNQNGSAQGTFKLARIN